MRSLNKMSNVKVIEGPDFMMTNIISDELLEKVFYVANFWVAQEIEKINNERRRIVGIEFRFKPVKEEHVPDNVVNFNVTIASQ